MAGILFYVLYLILGVLFANLILAEKKPGIRLWAGSVCGTVAYMWSHLPFSLFLGFTVLSHLLGLVLTLALLAICFWITAARQENPWRRLLGNWKFSWDKSGIILLAVLIPLMLYAFLCLDNHILNESQGAYQTGQCTYGDLNFHLGIITSVAEQGTFPPDYNIFPGRQLDYYFLCDSVSSSLYLFGTGLRTAYILPVLIGFAQVFAGFWFLAQSIVKRAGKTLLAFLLFFFNGGLGLFYFLDNLREDKTNFTKIFTAYYQTPTNYVNSGTRTSNICWTNTVVDMMLPQRATLFGWMILLLVLYLLYHGVFEGEKNYFLPAGILGGLIPMIQTYAYFTLGLVALCWLIYSCIKEKFSKGILLSWLRFGLPAVLLAVPQFYLWIFGAVSDEKFLRFSFNAYNASDNWLWFWVKNVGIVFLLIPFAFFNASRKKKAVYAGGLLIFIVAELVVFQTYAYDNNKLYLIWYLFTAILVADFLVECYDRLQGVKGRSLLAALLIVVCVNAAFFTMIREYVSGTPGNSYTLYNADEVKGAEFVRENTAPSSLFLSYYNHNNAVSCLTGRNIYCGAATFLYSHGVDYSSRQKLIDSMFTDAEVFEENKAACGVDYVWISSWERSNYQSRLIEDYLAEHYSLVYSQGDVTIYQIS